MRLWSLHPRHLDAKGLVAVWREGLLALSVLRGRTRGYRRHPQLDRFRSHARPVEAVRSYLRSIFDEARTRGYAFDARKIGPTKKVSRIPVGKGQLQYERGHLLAKLRKRDRALYRELRRATPDVHPLFRPVPGGVEPWERPFSPRPSRRTVIRSRPRTSGG